MTIYSPRHPGLDPGSASGKGSVSVRTRDVGVVGIYGPGSNIVECVADVLRLLGHNMPPEGLSEAAE